MWRVLGGCRRWDFDRVRPIDRRGFPVCRLVGELWTFFGIARGNRFGALWGRCFLLLRCSSYRPVKNKIQYQFMSIPLHYFSFFLRKKEKKKKKKTIPSHTPSPTPQKPSHPPLQTPNSPASTPPPYSSYHKSKLPDSYTYSTPTPCPSRVHSAEQSHRETHSHRTSKIHWGIE